MRAIVWMIISYVFCVMSLFINIFEVSSCFQQCKGHITRVLLLAEETGTYNWSSWSTIGKQILTFPHKVQGLNLGGECVITAPLCLPPELCQPMYAKLKC